MAKKQTVTKILRDYETYQQRGEDPVLLYWTIDKQQLFTRIIHSGQLRRLGNRMSGGVIAVPVAKLSELMQRMQRRIDEATQAL